MKLNTLENVSLHFVKFYGGYRIYSSDDLNNFEFNNVVFTDFLDAIEYALNELKSSIDYVMTKG